MNRVSLSGSYPSRSIRTGSRCTTLTKLPVAFCGGSNASVDPVPIVKPETLPLNTCRPPYMSTYRSAAWPMRRSPSWRLFEISVDPDIVERADRHQILANLHVISRVDVPARNDAVNLCDDVTITKIQFGLSEIAFGGFELGFGLLDGRSLGRDLSEIAVDVAVFCELVEHLLRALTKRMDNTDLGCALDQVCLRLEDRRKGLIEIWRHMTEIFAVTGLRR